MTAAVPPFLASPKPLAYAHRGGAHYGPNLGIENSLAAFENAVRLGYTYLETDARVSSDGVVFAFHDASLDRTTDHRGELARLPASTIERAQIGGREPVPLLREVLDAFPDVHVNIDVKEMAAVAPTLRVIDDARAGERVCIASFSHRRLSRVRALAPYLATSASPPEIARMSVRPWRVLPWLRRLGASCVQVPTRQGWLSIVTPRFVETAHDLGLEVHVWTIDDPDDMNHLLDLGVDGLMSDRIDVLKDVLTARGQWTGGDAR
ncbi:MULTISPECIES: glycerophosphodiester phosphodiesterase [unclassified Mumia]|uniref:glycerophosphodiester phosphodiesterase n=1 Tax=unclassified Mumia TaxID=2621872 RepID=UPI0026273AF2|nr:MULTISPECIES: glycerophosphodiester phosphodiesterase [unclassified Mumia]MDD9349533.1 glycerophosphodiester phosphodiesterase [Mumia sp.]